MRQESRNESSRLWSQMFREGLVVEELVPDRDGFRIRFNGQLDVSNLISTIGQLLLNFLT